MKVSVSDAKAQLTDLVRRAEAGEEIVLTRHGHPAVRLVPVAKKVVDIEKRTRALEKLLGSARPADGGPDAARSQDFLYGEDGMPK